MTRILIVTTLVVLLPLVAAHAVAAEPPSQHQQFLQAYRAYQNDDVKRGETLAAQLQGYILYPYLQYEGLRRRLATTAPEEVFTFIAADGGSYLGEQLRTDWLALLAGERRWDEFLGAYTPQKDITLQCHYLSARVRTGRTDGLLEEIKATWLTGDALPAECDQAVAWFAQSAAMTGELVWERIRLAMNQGNLQLAAQLARSLSAEDRHWAGLWRDMHTRPAPTLERAEFSRDTPRSREILRYGIERLGRQDAGKANEQWRALSPRHAYSGREQAEVAAAIAVAAVKQGHTQALALLDEVPDTFLDAGVQRVRLRAGLDARDWPRLKRWTEQPAAPDMEVLSWRYWRARALEELGDRTAAGAIYRELAGERDYYGLLAAARLGMPYRFEHQPVKAAETDVDAFTRLPGIMRAHELYDLGMYLPARREWHFVVNRLDTAGLTVAAVAAHRWGWHDRAIEALGKAREYADIEIRFPVAFKSLVDQYAGKHDLEPAVMLSVIRSESAFSQDARSSMGAMGLMQLMPLTGRQTARKLGHQLKGPQDLLDAEDNIKLGSAYLKGMLEKYGGNLAMAAAAYNAGPHRVEQWRPQADCEPADVWVDTIPFTETRHYVHNVLFYTAIYETRLKQEMKPLQQRLLAIPAQKVTSMLDCRVG